MLVADEIAPSRSLNSRPGGSAVTPAHSQRTNPDAGSNDNQGRGRKRKSNGDDDDEEIHRLEVRFFEACNTVF